MKRRVLTLLFALVVTLSFSACIVVNQYQPEATASQTPQVSEPVQTSEPSETASETAAATQTAAEDCQIAWMYADDAAAGQFTSIYTYGSGPESYIVYFNQDVGDFALFNVDYDGDTQTFSGVGAALYQLDTLKAGEGVQLNITVPEGAPNMMVTFTTLSGDTLFYPIAYNGRDGGLSLVSVEISAGNAEGN